MKRQKNQEEERRTRIKESSVGEDEVKERMRIKRGRRGKSFFSLILLLTF